MSVKDFLAMTAVRRTNYKLGGTSPIPAEEITAIVREIVRQSPSAFNSQSPRVAILYADSSKKFWEIAYGAVKAKAAPEKAGALKEKMDAFAAGFGTILYFDDEKVTKAATEQFPAYAENFSAWAQQANAMIQFSVWTALSVAGLGASLQHYNPVVDIPVREEFGFPVRWKLIAQMPFGAPLEPPPPKPPSDIGSRVIVL